MKLSTLIRLTPALALLVSSTAFADLKPEDAIKYRQAGYSFMAWNMSKIKAMVVDDSEAFDQKKMIAAANTIAAIANSGMGALYIPGTEKDIGNIKTRVKPEFFTDTEGVRKVATDFFQAANEMQKVAQTDDVDAIEAQYKKLGGTCKACHDHYRKD